MDSSVYSSSSETSVLLAAVRKGEGRAADLLFVRLYDELRRLSGVYVAAESHGATLSATDLVHEAYLKLIAGGDWKDRAHFMAVAARVMRQILIDRARARRASKRGGDRPAVTLDYNLIGILNTDAAGDSSEQILAVDAALEQLATRDADLARVVELRFFGGLEVREVAEVLAVSERTVARQWSRAKAHLRAELV